jgi:L-lactate utilization protein LutC|tara:strand:- start:904 stop:1491 length:588 start_codon:yes stop_codon:yes gene_type:complete
MDFLKNLFKSSEKRKSDDIKKQKVSLSLDDTFVHNFIDLGGKFLYCIKKEDVINNISNIIEENNWKKISCNNSELKKYIKSIDVEISDKLSTETPFFTNCEQLISENGSLLFSSNQLKDFKISTLTNDFIVFAKTSQIVKNMGESLTGIKLKYKGDLPTNISSIKNYDLNKEDDNFMSYGNNNSKKLYLLLLEDF